ncbi:class I SAM-dependent methyltransferase [Rhodopseudomonas palustris]|uniref:class I SAM-dependent methyltransferase n=1 Tax=Rhodopseudomonas palustris TaxID=1076 RepID=UPI002ACE5545|nr:class I SAM-dependent methyltransferase [Rhodopseudomonas palustris]WQG99215.1 class I SAM-dependent methyltransferase [Rhodopseudomonas palustris]
MNDLDKILVRQSAERLYQEGQPIWSPDDRWNVYKRSRISKFATMLAKPIIDAAPRILDAGCGSEPYSWLPERTVSFDKFHGQIKGRSSPVAGDLERLPFGDRTFDLVVCVASVLNYVSAAEAIQELSRVVRPGGHLLIHYETSTSFEHLFSSRWGKPVVRIDTINNGEDDTLWVYNPNYINALLGANGFRIVKDDHFHILSALALRFGLKQGPAAFFASADRFVGAAWMFSDDVITLVEMPP